MARSTAGVPGIGSLHPGESDEPSATDIGEPALVKVSAIDIARGTVLAGRYQVEAVLGRGGSGIVLRAFDRVAQIPVAVKILKPELAADPRWIERFSRELRLARQIQHPNVCRVFDIAQADGHWFITMELATGGSLRDQLGSSAEGRSLDDKISDIKAIVAGLAAIHGAGIVHRDVKPDNFLRMADGRLVLSDFGLATNPSDGSMVSILVGTPSYMAPEVVLGEQSSFQSDVWALGVVLHEILFGCRPERTSLTNGRALLRLPQRELGSVERSLSRFVEQCLEDAPDSRPENGGVAQARFEKALSSRGPVWPSRRRARGSWALPALVVGGAIVAAAASGHWWRGATASSDHEGAAQPSLRGAPADWTNATSVVGSFDEPVHCAAWLEPDRLLRLIVGTPRRAVDLDVVTKAVRADSLETRAFAVGCPQRSSTGQLLFEGFGEGGRREILLATSEQAVLQAKALTPGSEPLWLPSGTEFVYSADDSHAAVFSISVMRTNIINELTANAGALVDKTVAADGKSIALRYLDQSSRRHVVLHELPSLAAIDNIVFDAAVTDFAFWGGTGHLVFALDDGRGNILAELDPATHALQRLGTVPGRDLRMPIWGRSNLMIAAHLFESDVWKVDNGVRTSRLTTEGRSYYPDLSAHDDLIVEYLGPDERFVIRLHEKGGEPRIVSSGPSDVTPRFLPDGKGWLYVDGARRSIRKCTFSDTCEDVLVSDELPFHPVASPDQRQIAFVTAMGRRRLKVFSGQHDVRDLGPARPECPPYWGTNNQIWVLQGTDQKLFWTELDVATGETVGTLPITEDVRNEPTDCAPLLAPLGASHPRQVAAWTSQSTQIRIVSNQQRTPYGHHP